MASRNTAAAASNESAIAPLPSSDRPCRTGGLADAQDAVIQTAGQQVELFSASCRTAIRQGGPYVTYVGWVSTKSQVLQMTSRARMSPRLAAQTVQSDPDTPSCLGCSLKPTPITVHSSSGARRNTVEGLFRFGCAAGPQHTSAWA